MVDEEGLTPPTSRLQPGALLLSYSSVTVDDRSEKRTTSFTFLSKSHSSAIRLGE